MRSYILSIAKLSRAVSELSLFRVFDAKLLGAWGEEGGAPAIWAAASGDSGAAFGVSDFDVLLALLVGFTGFSIIFYGVHHIEKGMKFNKKSNIPLLPQSRIHIVTPPYC